MNLKHAPGLLTIHNTYTITRGTEKDKNSIVLYFSDLFMMKYPAVLVVR